MPLAELRPGTQDWKDVAYAALVLCKASQLPDLSVLQNGLRNKWPTSSVVELYTGINQGRKAVVSTHHDTIVIGFQGSGEDEIMKNMWTHGKGPNWWDIPYPVHLDGNQVHSFYLDMWNGMKDACLTALSKSITAMQQKDLSPSKVIIAGYSMGGGVST